MKKNSTKGKLTTVGMGTTVALLLSEIQKGCKLEEFTSKQIEFLDMNPNHMTSETTLLNYAIGCGNDYIASYLLEKGADVNLSSKCFYVNDTYSITPIGWAVRKANTEMFEKLLKAGAKWNFDNKKINLLNIISKTPDTKLIFEKLIEQVLKNENETIQFLQMLFSNKNVEQHKPIEYIIGSKNVDLLKILEKNADKFKINEIIFFTSEQVDKLCKASKEIKELMCSISEKGIFVVEYKGEKQKLDMNSLTEMTEEVNKQTLLIKLGELFNQTKITEKEEGLVHSICKYLAKDSRIIEIIQNTILKKHFDRLEIMLKAIDGLEIGNKSTFLTLLFKPQNEKLLEFFIQKVPVNTVDSAGKTLLHSACHFNKTEIVKMLLLRKADINKKDNSGKGVLDYAKNNEEMQGLLTEFQKNQKLLIEKLQKEQQELKDKQFEILNNEEKKQHQLKELEKLELLKQEVEKEKTTSNKNKEFENAYQELSNPKNEKSLGEYFNGDFNLIEDYKKFVEEKEKFISVKKFEKQTVSWVVEGRDYVFEKNVKYHFEYSGKQYYFVVDKKLENMNIKFWDALDLGFANGKKGYSGIKLLKKHSLIEIKVVDEKHRIFAKEGHENPQKDILIILDREGSHADVKNNATKGDLILCQVQNVTPSDLLFSNTENNPNSSNDSNSKEIALFGEYERNEEN